MTEHYRLVEQAVAGLARVPAGQVAAEAGLSPQYFQKLFKRYVGISPRQFRAALKLSDIKQRLVSGERILPASWDAGLSGSGRTHDLFVTYDAVTPGEFQSGGRGVRIAFGRAQSPYGDVFLAATPRGVCALHFLTARKTVAVARRQLTRCFADAVYVRDDATAQKYATAIFRYAHSSGAGGASFTPLHIRGTNFQINVWRALLAIPRGRVMTYAQLSQALTGSANSARAVGAAAANNPLALVIPCHRLLASNGDLRGYASGIARKRRLLAAEFAAVEIEH